MRFAAEGAAVAVLDIDGDSAKATAKEIDGIALAVDVTDAEALRGAVDAAADHLGGVSILVNNAGGSTMVGLADWDPDEWDRIVRLNLTGVFNGMRAGVPHLLAGGGGGAVVNTASISATRPSAGETPYSAAKAGVIALTRVGGARIRPRHPRQRRGAGHDPHQPDAATARDRARRRRPLPAHDPGGRVGEPEDVADVMVFLCSDLARFITGQTIVVDGGMTLHGAGVDGLFDRFFRGGHPHQR